MNWIDQITILLQRKYFIFIIPRVNDTVFAIQFLPIVCCFFLLLLIKMKFEITFCSHKGFCYFRNIHLYRLNIFRRLKLQIYQCIQTGLNESKILL